LGQKIGSVEKTFVNECQEPEYVRVRMGLSGLRSVLIPVGFVEIDEELRPLCSRRETGARVYVADRGTK
jgi:hypothetical protein